MRYEKASPINKYGVIPICGDMRQRGGEDAICYYLSGSVSKITKAHYRRLGKHIFVEKPRRSTTAPVFFVSICKPIQQNGIFQTLETHPRSGSQGAKAPNPVQNSGISEILVHEQPSFALN
jgi:hypothetical protein